MKLKKIITDLRPPKVGEILPDRGPDRGLHVKCAVEEHDGPSVAHQEGRVVRPLQHGPDLFFQRRDAGPKCRQSRRYLSVPCLRLLL